MMTRGKGEKELVRRVRGWDGGGKGEGWEEGWGVEGDRFVPVWPAARP